MMPADWEDCGGTEDDPCAATALPKGYESCVKHYRDRLRDECDDPERAERMLAAVVLRARQDYPEAFQRGPGK